MTKGKSKRIYSSLSFQKREQPVKKAKPQTDYFNKLPPEIISDILLVVIERTCLPMGPLHKTGILEFTKRINKLELVCRNWSSIIRSIVSYSGPIFHMKTVGCLCVADIPMNTEKIESIMKNHGTNINNLILLCGEKFSRFKKIMDPMQNNKLAPVTLELKYYKSGGEDSFRKDIEECIDASRLTYLEIRTLGDRMPFSFIKTCSQLTSLHLGGRLPIRDVVNFLNCTPNLECLSLNEIVASKNAVTSYEETPHTVQLLKLQMLDVDCSRHARMVKFLVKIKFGESMLDLRLKGVRDEDICYLLEQKTLSQSLEDLSLSFEVFSMESTMRLLREYTKLRRLKLGGNHLAHYCHAIIRALMSTSDEENERVSLCPMLQGLVLLPDTEHRFYVNEVRNQICDLIKIYKPVFEVYISGYLGPITPQSYTSRQNKRRRLTK